MKKSLLNTFAIIFILAFAAPVLAQEKAPVEITAAGSLEWNRKAKTYTARKDAVLKNGAVTISADTLTAEYQGDGASEITRLTAKNNVVIQSPPYTAVGDNCTYDISTGAAVLTGQNLKISTPTEFLTASEKIEFSTAENRLTAIGQATATRGTDTLAAQKMTALFSKDTTGKLALNKITAEGDVTIKTARETVHGDSGVYDVNAGKASLTGKIRIYQGESWIEGTRADVDLKTGTSKLFAEGNAATEGRVKGIFYPSKKAP
jgi:lipopolysaccharide export system protein LptA